MTRSTRHATAPGFFRLDSGLLVAVRPLRPEDARLYPAFDERLSDDDRRLRFFSAAHMTAGQIHAFTHFDRTQASALVATEPAGGAMLGVTRLHRLEDGVGEFAVLVRSDLKGQGLGRELMSRVLATAGTLGISTVLGLILRENVGMLALAGELGFALQADPDDAGLVRAELALPAHAHRWSGGQPPDGLALVS